MKKLYREVRLGAGTQHARTVKIQLKRIGSWFCSAKQAELAIMDVVVSTSHDKLGFMADTKDLVVGQVRRAWHSATIAEKGYFYWEGDYPRSYWPARTTQEILDRLAEELPLNERSPNGEPTTSHKPQATNQKPNEADACA